ncbi:MAG: zinc finger Ran-binding domain-containing protein [Acidianus sp.]|uniref:zinc finger Ran-binding domain-containing protein n=1 Tax=Acidianus sp. TaxID=1872104 RepID=UPI00397E53BE
MNKTFQGVYVDPYQLETWLAGKGYKTQILRAGNYVVVQAKKEGILRTIFGADRAFTVRLYGGQGFLQVDIGMSNWLKAGEAAEDIVAAMVFMPLAAVECVEEIYNVKIEHDIMKEIERLVSQTFQPTFNQPMFQPMTQQPMMPPIQEKICNACGYRNPPHARFCMNCGNPL